MIIQKIRAKSLNRLLTLTLTNPHYNNYPYLKSQAVGCDTNVLVFDHGII